MSYLPYPEQRSELDKLMRLDPAAFDTPPRELPALGPVDPAECCVVCGAHGAKPCGGCGFAHYCGVEHQRQDERYHRAVCASLAQVQEDRASRAELGDAALVELMLKRAAATGQLASFEDYLGVPEQGPLEAPVLRRMTELASRPLTLAGVLFALKLAGPETRELRVHVMGAAAREHEAPLSLWGELARFFPRAHVELSLVGPELEQRSAQVAAAGRLSVRTRRGLYDTKLWEQLGKPDLVIGFNCGLVLYPTWENSIKSLIRSGAPFVITSYRSWEVRAEAKLLVASRARPLFNPRSNLFASRAPRPSTTLVNDVSFDNAFVSAWR